MKLLGFGPAPVTADLVTGLATGEGHYRLRTVEELFGGSGPDTFSGDDGPNRLTGTDGNDHLEGRGGNDVLQGDRGTDFLDGGAGAHDRCLHGETVFNCES